MSDGGGCVFAHEPNVQRCSAAIFCCLCSGSTPEGMQPLYGFSRPLNALKQKISFPQIWQTSQLPAEFYINHSLSCANEPFEGHRLRGEAKVTQTQVYKLDERVSIFVITSQVQTHRPKICSSRTQTQVNRTRVVIREGLGGVERSGQT